MSNRISELNKFINEPIWPGDRTRFDDFYSKVLKKVLKKQF